MEYRIDQRYDYYVVDFLEQPYEDINTLVCVPYSWITFKRKTDRRVNVAYPAEKLANIEKKVRSKKAFKKEWNHYLANIKYGTDSFKSAVQYIDDRNINRPENSISSDNLNSVGNKVPPLILSLTDPARPCLKRPPPLTSEKEDIQRLTKIIKSATKLYTTSKNISSNKFIFANLGIDHENTFNLNIADQSSKAKPHITLHDEESSSSSLTYSSEQSNDGSNPHKHWDNQIDVPLFQDPSHHDIFVHNPLVQKSSETNTIGKIDGIKDNINQNIEHSNQSQQPHISHNDVRMDHRKKTKSDSVKKNTNRNITQNTQNYTKKSNIEEYDQTLTKRFANILDELEESLSQTSVIIKQCQEKDNDFKSFMNKLINEIPELQPLTTDAAASTSKSTLSENKEKDKNKQTANKIESKQKIISKTVTLNENIEHENNDDNDNSHQTTTKRRGSKLSFKLPQEYDAKDSRWTLKHKKSSPGIIELIPHSRIYVNQNHLDTCKRVAKDYKSFARMLLVEIFSQKALSVCSWTGAKANAFALSDSDVRPGLDETAREALVIYVADHGKEKEWGPFDHYSVVNSLRSKIQEIRSKHGLRK